MKIVLGSREFPPQTADGGIGTQTYLKAHNLARLGHDVTVVSSSSDRRAMCYYEGAVKVVRIPGIAPHLPSRSSVADWLTYSTRVASVICQLHRESPIDVVEFPEWASEGYAHLLNQTGRKGRDRIPTVLQLHGPLVMIAHTIGWPNLDSDLFRIGTAMEESCLRLADRVYSSSRRSLEWCVARYDVPQSGIEVLHAGVDISVFTPLDHRERWAIETAPAIAFVGRVSPEKGIHHLVQAVVRLFPKWPELSLKIIGRGDVRFIEELRNMASMCPGLLKFEGFVDRRALALELAHSDIFAMPSLYEPGPGLAYLEAMACGLPVVACNNAGAVEVVRHGQNGLLVPPGDIDALENCLHLLLADSTYRRWLSLEARQFALAFADSVICTQRIVKLYEETLASPNRM